MHELILSPDLPELLSDEYFALRETYEDYQNQSMIIKGWSVTVGLSTILLCYRSKPGEEPPALAVFLCSLAVLPFYAMDVMWKAFQGGYQRRLEEIECLFRSTVDEICTRPLLLQSFASWSENLEGWHLIWAMLKVSYNPTVVLPHIFIFVFGLLLAGFLPPRKLKRG